jgi:hypothetical protein
MCVAADVMQSADTAGRQADHDWYKEQRHRTRNRQRRPDHEQKYRAGKAEQERQKQFAFEPLSTGETESPGKVESLGKTVGHAVMITMG